MVFATCASRRIDLVLRKTDPEDAPRQNANETARTKQKHASPQSTHFVKKLLALSSAETCAEVMDLYLERSFAYGSRPKWQYAAVSWYLGSRSAKDCAMAPGRQSKAILMTLVMSSAVSAPCSVPYVSTNSDKGFATPMA